MNYSSRFGVGVVLLILPMLSLAGLSARQGHHLAVLALGHDTRAYLRLDVAAHQGDAVAMNWLGAYWESRGNSVRARKDYLLAAAAGNRTAALNLGYLYRFGHGVPVDLPLAVSWYRRAARLGSNHALAELGNAYYLGEGVAANQVQAYQWYWLAARHSSRWHPELEALAGQIGPEQATHARAEARLWLMHGKRP